MIPVRFCTIYSFNHAENCNIYPLQAREMKPLLYEFCTPSIICKWNLSLLEAFSRNLYEYKCYVNSPTHRCEGLKHTEYNLYKIQICTAMLSSLSTTFLYLWIFSSLIINYLLNYAKWWLFCTWAVYADRSALLHIQQKSISSKLLEIFLEKGVAWKQNILYVIKKCHEGERFGW